MWREIKELYRTEVVPNRAYYIMFAVMWAWGVVFGLVVANG